MAGYRNEPRKKLLDILPKNAICAEIGVWKGGFSGIILDKTKPAELHLIDPWSFQPKFGHSWYGGQLAKNERDMEAIFNIVTERFNKYNNISIHREYSELAVKRFEDKYFDWVYVDGNHDYNYVLKDLELYYPKIREGGYISGDDFDLTSVRKAVRDFCIKHNKTFQTVGITQFYILV